MPYTESFGFSVSHNAGFPLMKIGFVSDIHEDIDSLRQAFTVLERANCDIVVCLGDIVGFTLHFQKRINHRDANACIAMVRDECAAAVAGNHDLYAIRRIPQFNAGFPYRDNWYDLEYEQRARLSRHRVWLYEDSELPTFLTDESLTFLRRLPEFLVRTYDDIPFVFSHFHYPDLSGSRIDSLRKARHLRSHFSFMAEQDAVISVSGHGHPEGCALSDRNKLRFHSFGSYQLDTTLQWIVCPCVAHTARANGVATLDTVARQLDVLPLGPYNNTG